MCLKQLYFMHLTGTLQALKEHAWNTHVSCMNFHAWSMHEQNLIHACFRPNHALFLPVKRPKSLPVSGKSCMFQPLHTLAPNHTHAWKTITFHAWNVLKHTWDMYVSGAIFWVGNCCRLHSQKSTDPFQAVGKISWIRAGIQACIRM